MSGSEHFGELDAVEERMCKKLVNTYKRLKSTAYQDEEVAYLKRHGVLLPNGFTPDPPLFSESGEIMLKLFNEDNSD
jgi:hypothetical protein